MDELERAILEDPDAIAPRMVYADWLASQGSPLGEWLALQRAIAEQPATIELRTAALEYLTTHAASVLGPAAEMLDGLYLGWHGGFVDEIRFHSTERIARGDAAGNFAALLAHPIARFVRTISIGTFGAATIDALLDVLEEQTPLLFEALVLFDSWDPVAEPRTIDVDIARVLRATKLRRLGLSRVAYESELFDALPDTLEELVLFGPGDLDGFERAKLPKLVELVLLDPRLRLHRLPALPALRRLRVIGMGNALAAQLADCAPVLAQLELLDISHGHVDAEVRARIGRLDCRVLQKRMEIFPDGNAYHICKGEDPDGDSWLLERLATEGRDGLAVTPHAGIGLYNASCVHNTRKRFDVALAAASAAMTLPDELIGGWGWGNVGYAHEQLGHDAEAELAAREGLLRHPRSANFHGMLIGALRAQGRTAQAVALVRPALHTITAQTRVEEARECLVEIVCALVESGEPARAVALANRKQKAVAPDTRLHAAIALAQVAAGELDGAKQRLRLAADLTPDDNADLAILHHAEAAHSLALGHKDAALAALEKARAHRGWRFVIRDPRFAALQLD